MNVLPNNRRRVWSGSEYGVFLLVIQLARAGFDRIPPVTISIIGICAALYMQIFAGFLHNLEILHANDTCFSFLLFAQSGWGFGPRNAPGEIGPWKRLLFSSFFHAA